MARALNFFDDGSLHICRFPDADHVMWFIETEKDLQTALEGVAQRESERNEFFWLVITRRFMVILVVSCENG